MLKFAERVQLYRFSCHNIKNPQGKGRKKKSCWCNIAKSGIMLWKMNDCLRLKHNENNINKNTQAASNINNNSNNSNKQKVYSQCLNITYIIIMTC